jgi:hypothetical protein
MSSRLLKERTKSLKANVMDVVEHALLLFEFYQAYKDESVDQ